MKVKTYTRIVRTIPDGTGSKIEPFDFYKKKDLKKWFKKDKKKHKTAEYEKKKILKT